MAKLRGSKEIRINAVAQALQIALDSAVTEKELRQMILGIIKNLKK